MTIKKIIPLEFAKRVEAIKNMKENKVARTVAGENDDLCPLVEVIRQDKVVCTIVAPQVDRDMGLQAVRLGAEVMEASEVWMMTDAHVSHSTTGPDGKPWAPGGMQNACDGLDACSTGLITDTLMIYGRNRAGDKQYMIVAPYHVHKTNRTVHWVDDEMECVTADPADEKTRIEGFVPDCFEQFFAADTVHTLMATGKIEPEFADVVEDIKDMPEVIRLASTDMAACGLLTMQGFGVILTVPDDPVVREIYARGSIKLEDVLPT